MRAGIALLSTCTPPLPKATGLSLLIRQRSYHTTGARETAARYAR